MKRNPRHLNERGASLAEYALLLAFISVVSIGSIALLGGSASSAFDDAASRIGDPAVPAAPGDEEPGSPPPPGGGGGAPTTVVTTTTLPPETVPTTQPPATTTTTTTPPPPPARQTRWEGKATGDAKNWSAEATVTVYGTNGEPLKLNDAHVQVRVIREIMEWDGTPDQHEYLTQAKIRPDGTATFQDKNHSFDPDDWHVSAVRFEVVQVFYYYPSNPQVKWDGVTSSSARILPP